MGKNVRGGWKAGRWGYCGSSEGQRTYVDGQHGQISPRDLHCGGLGVDLALTAPGEKGTGRPILITPAV